MGRGLFKICIVYFWKTRMFPPKIIIYPRLQLEAGLSLSCLTNHMKLDGVLYIPGQDLNMNEDNYMSGTAPVPYLVILARRRTTSLP
jgi:hypothetical protein